MSTTNAASAAACAPEGGRPKSPPEPAKTSALSPDSPIAVVSLLMGRRREPRHWLIAAHGDPAGLAARLQGTLAEFAAVSSPGGRPSSSPCASTATSARANATANGAPNTSATAPSRAKVGAEQSTSPNPAPGARSQTSSQARSRGGSSPRVKSGPEQLLQRAFRDCTALERPDPPSEASYRYRLSLPSGRLASASLACWRRYSPGGTWQRRCGPMGLAHFLDHHGRQPNQFKSVHLY